MREIIKMLDKKLKYIGHEIKGEEIHIQVKSRRKAVKCPYCGRESKKVHSVYQKSVQDMAISGKKVYIEITNRKMFCRNEECSRKTFAERYEFVGIKGKKTKRLETEIINMSLNTSSMESAKMLTKSTVKISASTIRNLLKKMEVKESGESR